MSKVLTSCVLLKGVFQPLFKVHRKGYSRCKGITLFCSTKIWFCLFFLAFLGAISIVGCDQTPTNQLENNKIRLAIDPKNGTLAVFDDLTYRQSLLDTICPAKSLWQIHFRTNTGTVPVDMELARDFSFEKKNDSLLTLIWQQFDHADYADLRVSVSVRIGEDQSFSYWKIHLSGIQGKEVESVIFPRISGLRDMGEEYLAVSNWTGAVLKNPRQFIKSSAWGYPGALSMQLITLYNPEKIGFYASCNDSLSYKKDFALSLEAPDNLIYHLVNYPEFDISKDSYSPAYEAVIGSYRGDWFTAAEHYRDWARNQKWCRESRLKNGRIPAWAEETALWVWNRGKSPGVLLPATELKQKLGLTVSVLWHWWHGCSYDDGFPEYVPPREGRSQFIEQVEKAKQQGVRPIVYMNQIQWGNTTESWKTENVSLSTVKDMNGKEMDHVYNIFSGKGLTVMCVATDFWRNKYASLADTVINHYDVGGVYMDQTCLSYRCFDPSHRHPVGGGNYWVENSGKISTQIRALTKRDEAPALAGEGSGESWIPHLDLFLTLQASKERYAGVGGWETIPLYQVVYHPYSISFGSYSSLLKPPYDELWPSEFAPKDALQLLDEKYNEQFLMEQARSFIWGSQPMIANYRTFLETERKPEMEYLHRLVKVRMKGLKYLLYGEYLKMPETQYPTKELKISRLSIYAGRTGSTVTELQGVFPLIYSSAWKADDGTLGIPFASISDQAFPLKLTLKADAYGMPPSGNISVIDETGKKLLSSYQNGEISIDMLLPPKGICIFEVEP